MPPRPLSGTGEADGLDRVFIVVTAGHVTTVRSIGNGMFNLLTHPEELAKLRADPSLIPAAVDELMRPAAALPGPDRPCLLVRLG